ncbi:MFS transporter [Marinibaculum pumilum]|uniref:MFS transporter n=1 Tax=Marinibaculum pumilum TaxID=1766165 RepID=A0ABV7L087_9PROT
MTPFWTLSAAGFAATAIAYGPARMGFGLFLSQFRTEFSISTQTAGLVSSLGFLGFLLGLLAAQVMTNRKGPRLPVTAGLSAATLGMAIVAVASNLPVLAAGIFLAMASAGLSWTPFNNAVHRRVEDGARPVALSWISTGTGVGIALAGAAALLMSLSGLSWRVCWGIFAIGAALALLVNRMALRQVAGTDGPGPAQRWGLLRRRSAIPLLAIGFCFGTTSAVYISFAPDRIADAGGLAGLPRDAAGGLVFLCFGAFGLLGLVTGGAKAAIGLPWLVRLLMLAAAVSLALVAAAPTWPGVILSAGLQGIYVMMTSAVLAFWSDRLFPALPSQSFTAVLLAVAVGSVLGPAAAGFASDAIGSAPMFLAVAALAAATALVVRARHIRERPETETGPEPRHAIRRPDRPAQAPTAG